jgi:hypothetical protein
MTGADRRRGSVDALAFVTGTLAGVTVTSSLHRRPPEHFWAQPLPRTRRRRADLPLGGALALLLAAVAPAAMRRPLRALGCGAAAGCLVTALVDPLVEEERCRSAHLRSDGREPELRGALARCLPRKPRPHLRRRGPGVMQAGL